MIKRRNYPRTKRPIGYRPDFREYERRKAAWIADNTDPPPTHLEYSEAMRKIAARCGI